MIERFFAPLGYTLEETRHDLDEQFPDWGGSRYYTLQLQHTLPLHTLLSHLYVLLPALGQDLHYYVGQNEIQKLLDKGKGWLEDHPAREEITRRYIKNLRSLTDQALERLSDDEDVEEGGDAGANPMDKERRKSLHQQRLDAVLEQLVASGANSVIDLGCGEGKLLRMLLKHKQFTRIVGTDVSYGELRKATERMHYEEMSPRQKERLELWQGALTYRDARMAGFDAAAVVEVIEHLDENRLQAFERVVFGVARPGTVVLTTPNAEYNVLYDNKNHTWHMEAIHTICAADEQLFRATPYRVVDTNDEASVRAATDWWLGLTRAGGEGMVVKHLDFIAEGAKGLLQPAVKCRGSEYLRIIYGPDYDAPHHLRRLKKRGLGKKRSLALREFALGVEALERFVRREPLRRVHESVFGVLALESEGVDPRL